MFLSSKVGSPLMYKAPEAFNLRGTVEGKPCDMWAFGVMAIEILADFYLSNKLPQIENGWLMDVHPTLHEILQEATFKTYFDVTFTKVEKNEDIDARMALNFVHGFLKMDQTERATSTESKQHPFLNGGSDVVNTTDDIWNDTLYMGASEFDDSFCSFDEDEIGFSDEYASNEGSERHSSSKTFKNHSVTDSYSNVNNPNMMADVNNLSKPKESKMAIYDQGNSTKFLSEFNFTDIRYGLEVSELESETNLELKYTNKFDTEHGISLSEKIRNIRLRIKELIENSGYIKDKNIPKAEPIIDEVYIQREDVGPKSKVTKEFHESLENNSKDCEEDFATGSKPTSLEATLKFVEAIKLLLKRYEDYKAPDFLSIDVSSKEGQEKTLKINLFGHNSAEANLPVDFTSTTVLETRGRRLRFIGWLQSKCLSVLKFCCPCMTMKSNSRMA